MTAARYCGQVVSVTPSEGRPNFGFIGLSTVTSDDGLAIETSQDIFLHRTDMEGNLQLGANIAFEVETDPKRGKGYLRAKNAIIVPMPAVVGSRVDSADRQVVASFGLVSCPKGGALQIATPMSRELHSQMKPVPADLVAKVTSNSPLMGLPRDEEVITLPDNAEGAIAQLMEEYLYRTYPQLLGLDIDFSVHLEEESDSDNELKTKAAVADYMRNRMAKQADKLQREWASFKQTRRLLAWVIEKGFVKPGTRMSPSILKSILELVKQIEAAKSKESKITAVQEVTEFMLGRDLLKPNSIVPLKLLPDLFMAAPVWFAARNRLGSSRYGNVEREFRHFCCGLVPSEAWVETWQLFNLQYRDLSHYDGDHMPRHIRELLTPAGKVFDAVVIMTPYHQVVVDDLKSDLSWPRPVDPYVIGFKKDLPFFCVLGRFSDTGIFPLYEELLADTVDFMSKIRGNLPKVLNRNKSKHQPFGHWSHSDKGPVIVSSYAWGTLLKRRCDDLIKAFHAGNLFDTIRTPDTKSIGTRLSQWWHSK